ncbi:MAG: phosphoribosylamine--glycine ligase [Deltaproteobacteria bacterium]|nr:phosphoribosylamine--glycine ligase [Deltaproteobacteria bacterium]
MRVLIVGSGGREHALAWKISRSPLVREVLCLPGNGGTAALGRNLDGSAESVDDVVGAARRHRADLVVVGPEVPLVAGAVERLRSEGLAAFGPTAAAARLEGSKVFSKRFLERHGIPTAPFRAFDDAAAAFEHVRTRPVPLVVKADGLAAGKGVAVCTAREEAEAALREMMVERRFGAAGSTVVVEDCLAGEEASLLVLTDGKRFVPLCAAQDHKRVGDGDTGPNTGGMGAYVPAPVMGEALLGRVLDRIVAPSIAGMAKDGAPFAGCLYVGLMMVGGEPFVLEFNVRFGDPETQPLLVHLEDDLVPALLGVARGELDERALRWHEGSTCCVVMAQRGYPGDYRKGAVIEGLDRAGALPDVVVFHAGTRRDARGATVVSGGRVLGVTARGADLGAARARAYEAVDLLRWDGAFCRRDIGNRGLGRAAG